MVGQVSPAVNAAVGPVARRQIRLESLGPCHLHHWSHGALAEVGGGPGGAPAGRVARETPEHAGKGRGLAGEGCVGQAPHAADAPHEQIWAREAGDFTETCGEKQKTERSARGDSAVPARGGI